MSEAVAEALVARKDEILERLKALLRLPSVSTDPAYAEGMKATREFLLARLKEAGLTDVRLLDGGGQPAVTGAWMGAPGKPTLIVYGHYDVQPPDPLNLWISPPFEPTIRDGRIYARGASDVKGSTLIAVETVAAFIAAGGCPVNIRFFLEGEEEIGSPSLLTLIERNRDALVADAVLSADGGRASTTLPTVNVGSRGLTKLEVTLRTASKDMHSGRYGGAVRNANHELAKLIAGLHDDAGRIAVPGFFDDLAPIGPRERADAAALAMKEAEFYGDIAATPYGDPALGLRERITLMPTIEVNGMWGGYTGAGSKTVLPCEAHAKFTMRLGPGQDPARVQKVLRGHLLAKAPAGVTLEFLDQDAGSPAFTLREGHPLLVAAERVIETTTGRAPVRARIGGTLPITAIFQETLGLDTLMFGYAMPDEDVHAPNEFFRLSSLEEGLRGWPLLLSELGKVTPEALRGR
ncbi:M20 family dipeptidase [Roseomonas sp. JC162]|uniref:M20 family dipeptidase n=1 Tax=Neoroseomonas marina TaxID=1232220 RepID=A0A848E6C3_9PROT|nr:M20/M25/M40 family metallo-hydrolase [Neoroseomonas marina]NMJ39961.1 M20 family dipeptidase [Neoroseomonas marina]